MRKFLLAALVVVGLVAATPAQAQFKAGDWTLSLSGSGSNGPDFNGAAFGVNFELGRFVTDNIQLSLRQGVGYNDQGGSDNTLFGATALAADWHFNFGKWQPFVGVEAGYQYGAAQDNWFAGPEAGVKYFVNTTTFIQAKAEYQFNLDEGFSDGNFVYTVGLGFKL